MRPLFDGTWTQNARGLWVRLIDLWRVHCLSSRVVKITVCNFVEKSWKGHQKTLLFYGLFVVLSFTASYVFALRSTRSDVGLFTDWKSFAVGRTLRREHIKLQLLLSFVCKLLIFCWWWVVDLYKSTIRPSRYF